MIAMRRHLVSLACLVGWIRSTTATPLQREATKDLTIDLGYGVYEGAFNASTNLNVWKGIRFAAPPMGDLRWQSPIVPSTSRDVVVNATKFGAACPQSPNAPSLTTDLGSSREDCLFLNVYAPPVEPGRRLPVLVWIHGGGYGAGNGQQDMSEIINANDDTFIAVAIQYRLGAFGFLSSADVAANGVVNAGILDQAFALQWVQEHIHQFGGDRTRVTISGESAGAGSVMLLGIAKSGTLGTSLFRNAIAASPYLPPQYDFDDSVPTQKYEDFASKAGCLDSANVLVCLRTKDSATLQNANGLVNAAAFYGNWAFLPVTDYSFINSLPSTALLQQQVNGEHIVVGNNADEGPGFVPQNITTTQELQSWLEGNFPALNSTAIARIMQVYLSSMSNSTLKFATSGYGPVTALTTSPVGTGIQQLANNIYAEATFVCPSYWLNDAFTSQNRTSYHYQYSVPVALHGSDVSAYFGPAAPNQPDAFTTAFRQIWGMQIERAAPAAAASLRNLTWPAWVEGETSQMLNLNVTGGTQVQVELRPGAYAMESIGDGLVNDFTTVNARTWEGGRGERCAFWQEIAGLVPI